PPAPDVSGVQLDGIDLRAGLRPRPHLVLGRRARTRPPVLRGQGAVQRRGGGARRGRADDREPARHRERRDRRRHGGRRRLRGRRGRRELARVEARVTSKAETDLTLFFHPRTVAVIGATDNQKHGNYFLFKKVLARAAVENATVYALEIFPNLPGPKLALVTQSGHQGRPVAQGVELGVGITTWVPTGNEADLQAEDFIDYFVDDDEVAVIACYIEGFKDVAKLRRAAERAAVAGKPIVLVKIGRTEE